MQVLTLITKVGSKTKNIQVGNGKYVCASFLIPVVIDIHGHRVSEIDENVIWFFA